jgi:exodeoxyribonuclease V gamma subunit
MLHLHLSNRPDPLAMALAALLRSDPLTLLETEQVVAPSTAVSRWLSFHLADELGIATQLAFPFPAAFAWQLFGRVLPDLAAANPFDRAAMQWRLLRLLKASAAPAVQRYLVDDDGSRLHGLAGRLSGLFERYLVERPDWMVGWNAGKHFALGPDENWQAGIWRALMGELTGIGPEHPRERFLARLREYPPARVRLPRRICLFAVESMPALYWEVFIGLAEWIDLHVFVLTPSREYWGDIARARTQLRMEIESPEAAALFDVGHPLLASLGRARQAATVRLADVSTQLATTEHAYFFDPAASLLGKLQRDILELSVSTAVASDDSLQIHACHGALREAEVLHDRLLALFEVLPGLRPADVLILTPDIETYAPAVAAVLMHAVPGRRIPCTVADRPLGQLLLWRVLRRVIKVAEGDLDAESVMALLEEPAVRRAFGIDTSEVPQLRDWVAASGIRWGVDGRTRQRLGLPADEAHTWHAGLQRLLLGVAMPDLPERLLGDVLPIAGVEGTRAELLGRFIDYADAVFELAEKVGSGGTASVGPPSKSGTAPGRSVEGWTGLLTGVLERFLAPDETEERQAQRLREALATLSAVARTADCVVPLPLSVMLDELDAQLVERAPAQAFSSGAVTVAALQPGRPVPARVVCLIGMNDGAWPRPVTPLSFDLLAQHARIGDYNRRGEERYAFLEAVLCAKDALLVTFSGRDARSNVELPPAAPLAELIDTLAAMTAKDAAGLVVQHPLQPFSADYFDPANPTLFSYDAEHCVPGATRVAQPFLSTGSVGEAADVDSVALERLHRFIAHPVRFYLREQLGIHLEESEELLEIYEPFVASKLDGYRLRAAYFSACREDVPAAETTRLLRARGWLPQGVAGDLACAVAHDEALPLWQAARPWAEAEAIPPCEANFHSGCITLSGRLDGLSSRGLWRVRYGKTRPEDLLRLWLDHLLLQIAAPVGVLGQSVLVALDGVTTLLPQPQAAKHLADLLDVYRQGLQAPLPFYAKTAWSWLGQKANWRSTWEGAPYQKIPGERDDLYLRLALRDQGGNPLGEDFQYWARRIFTPLRAAMQAGKAGDD